MTVRPIRPDDVPAVVGLVRELADYEKALHEVRLTEEQLTGVLFGDSPALFGHVAVATTARSSAWRCGSSTSPPGAAPTASTSRTSTSSPRTAAAGLGRELLRTLAAVCVERGYSRLEWSVLDWNTPSIEFYKAAGAVPMDELDRLPPHRRRPDRRSPRTGVTR